MLETSPLMGLLGGRELRQLLVSFSQPYRNNTAVVNYGELESHETKGQV